MADNCLAFYVDAPRIYKQTVGEELIGFWSEHPTIGWICTKFRLAQIMGS